MSNSETGKHREIFLVGEKTFQSFFFFQKTLFISIFTTKFQRPAVRIRMFTFTYRTLCSRQYKENCLALLTKTGVLVRLHFPNGIIRFLQTFGK